MSKLKYMYSENDLAEILDECERQFDKTGIKRYKIDSIRFGNLRNNLASCIQTLNRNGNMKEEIVICKKLAQEGNDFTRADLKNLIMHEVIHSVNSDEIFEICKESEKPIFQNLSHGDRWNEIARQIEEMYPEYDFFTAKSYDDIVYPQFPVKYIYCCPKCGSVERVRKTETNIDSYCFFCGTPIKANFNMKRDI